MVKTDPFLEMIKNKEDEKKKKFKDALLFGKSEAHTDSGRAFVADLQRQFDEKGYLTPRQVEALYRVDSNPPVYRDYEDREYDQSSYYDHLEDDFDPYNP